MSTPTTPVSSRASTPTPDLEVVESPLYKSLLYSVRSPGALTVDAATEKNIPLENNPRPLRTFMNDSAEYWVDGSGSLLRMKFPARLDQVNGQYSRIGLYFNMPSTGLDVTILKRARAQFELRPLHESDPLSSHYPQEALDCSARALDTLVALTNEVEDARNASVEQTRRPGVSNFWRMYTEQDRYTFLVQSDLLFRDLPDPRALTMPHLSCKDIGRSGGLLSPSKSKKPVAASTNQAEKNAGLAQLGDTRVDSPDVRNEHGVLLNVNDYRTKLQDGDIVEVEVILKLWNIRPPKNVLPNSRDANGSRIYQLILRRMQLLPCAAYTKKAVQALHDPKGKRKATDELGGQSPAKNSKSSRKGHDIFDMDLGTDDD
ncbi:hypothetical protein F4604DRAFT_776883 [Suillus subluteus]|nr:hypothetical protein F4604DRAFT_776883 [Suillus subluteus]